MSALRVFPVHDGGVSFGDGCHYSVCDTEQVDINGLICGYLRLQTDTQLTRLTVNLFVFINDVSR